MDKRQKVMKEGSRSRKYVWITACFVLVIAAVLFLGSNTSGNFSATVIEPMDYSGLRIDYKAITPVENGELVGVTIEDIKQHRMLFFTYGNKPVLIYADQNGGIVASISVCEPCNNEDNFFIQNNMLVCGRCFTKWTLGSHAGVSGGCMNYPPAIIDQEINDGNVFVKKSDIENWTSRI